MAHRASQRVARPPVLGLSVVGALCVLAAACAEAPRAPGLSEASEPGEAGTDTPIVAASPTSVADPAEFIGLVHPPAPPEVDIFAGSLVRSVLEGPVESDHIVHEIRAGKHWMLWLSRRERWIRVEEARVPVWRVVDVEPIPPRMPGRRLMTFGCRLGDDPAVVALVEDEAVPELRNVHHAWRIDAEREIISPIPRMGVWCRNPGAAFRR